MAKDRLRGSSISPLSRKSWLEIWQSSTFWDYAEPSAHFLTPSQACGDIIAALIGELCRQHGLNTVMEIGAGDTPIPLGDFPRITIDQRGTETAASRISRWRTAEGRWSPELPTSLFATPALVVAAEWIDDLPCAVAERTPAGWQHTGPDGVTGVPVDAADAAWLDHWSPQEQIAEAGRTRDEAWAWWARRLPAGSVLVALDYGHTAETRPTHGTLDAHRLGRRVPPGTPDADLTAHVAVDALCAAVEAAGATRLSCTQLRDLPLPAPDAAPADALAALQRRSQEQLWRDPNRFGRFWWVAHRVGDNGCHA